MRTGDGFAVACQVRVSGRLSRSEYSVGERMNECIGELAHEERRDGRLLVGSDERLAGLSLDSSHLYSDDEGTHDPKMPK